MSRICKSAPVALRLILDDLRDIPGSWSSQVASDCEWAAKQWGLALPQDLSGGFLASCYCLLRRWLRRHVGCVMGLPFPHSNVVVFVDCLEFQFANAVWSFSGNVQASPVVPAREFHLPFLSRKLLDLVNLPDLVGILRELVSITARLFRR